MQKIEIIRNLKVESIVNFYQILLNKENIIQQSETLKLFRDYMILYLGGCLCESDINYDKSINIYRNLDTQVESHVWTELKSKIGCHKILFYEKTGSDNKFLFEV